MAYCQSFSVPRADKRPPASVPVSNYYELLTDASPAVDSGAGDNFGDEDTVGTHLRLGADGVTLVGITGDRRHSIGTNAFDLPLPEESLDFHVYKRGDIKRPLLSVGKVCDAGCKVTFDKDQCDFVCDNQLVLTGYRDPTTGLYLLPTKPQPATAPVPRDLAALNAYAETNVPKLMRYLHACAGFPVAATWIQAIDRGYFTTWPGLSASRVRKYLPKSEETAKGHMKLVRQGIRSTSKGDTTEAEEGGTSKGAATDPADDVESPSARETSAEVGRKRNLIACSVPMKGIIGTDQTGRFPVESDRGHKYIFILYDVDTELIHAVPIKSKHASELIEAFKEGYDMLARCGFEPVLHRIDNETSSGLVSAIESKGLKYETVPPGDHRRNPAERAISTFKSHFIAILNGLDSRFPEGAWDELIPQTNLTLNLLRTCSVNPAHSAYSYIHGAFDFSAHPLAPLGCRAIFYEHATGKGGKRGSWANRGKVGYFVGPAMNSYRVWRFYNPVTKCIQKSGSASFFPLAPMPTTTVATQIAASLDRIKTLLEKPFPKHTDLHENNEINSVIRRLRGMYNIKDAPEQSACALRSTTKPASEQPVEETATPPRVEAKRDEYTGINRYRPKKKQRHLVGTRVRVNEKKNGKREVLLGKAEEYDPYTGLYRIRFDDGEWDEFDDDDMEYFKLVKTRPRRRRMTEANQIIVPGFFPKAGPAQKSKLATLGEGYWHVYGLNAGSIWDDGTSRWMAYRDLIKHPNPKIRERWNKAGLNEFARLAQGYGEVDGMGVVTFIAKQAMPDGKTATYARYVVDYRPEKDEPWRLRITCGGNLLEYDGNTTTHSASMETIKCQLNSIISSPGARAASADISNMYLGSDLPEAEYVRFKIELIPEDFVKQYNLRDLATSDGYVYARVNKAWYAGKIAHDDLVERLSEAGYKKADILEGYFYHESRDISFTLVVDDFLIKYKDKADLQHLEEAIGKYYKLKVDTECKQYVGIHLKWDYERRTVRLSMDGYIEQALKELEHSLPTKPYHAPSRYSAPKYGEKIQYATVDVSNPLGKKQIHFIQRAVGKLLYYARAVDHTMLHALNDISINTSKGTEATLAAMVYLLNYAATHPSAEIIYRASDMVLRVDSDAAYLVAPEARSRAGGYHYLSDKEGKTFNGPVMVLAKVIKNVMASAAEAELGALFMNGQEAVALRNCLVAMGHPQPATPLKTDNSTASGILNNTMKQKRSKAIDVRFYWLRDRAKQGQFHIFWDSGKHNLADYYTKHHPVTLHKAMRPIHTYVESLSPETLQGCIKIMIGEQSLASVRKSPNPKVELAASNGVGLMTDRVNDRRTHIVE